MLGNGLKRNAGEEKSMDCPGVALIRVRGMLNS